MPGTSGLDTLRALRAIDGNARVVMVSGAKDVDIALAMELGAVTTLAKPIDHRLMLGAIRSAIAPEVS